MKKIEFSHPHRRKHFHFFRRMNHPHFNVTVPVEITAFLSRIKDKGYPVNIALVYILSNAANSIPEFRWRIRENEVVEHPVVHPSFTVTNELTDVFSFCTVPYSPNCEEFVHEAIAVRESMKSNPSLEDEEGRDDYLFMSALPWIRFTGIQHAMQLHPGDSVPRISWGKFYSEGQKTYMPVSVQVHHALVDGRHVGQFYEKIEAFHANTESVFTR